MEDSNKFAEVHKSYDCTAPLYRSYFATARMQHPCLLHHRTPESHWNTQLIASGVKSHLHQQSSKLQTHYINN